MKRKDIFNLQVLVEDCIKPAVTVASIASKHNVSEEDVKRALEKGEKVEREHTDDAETARTIASHHLDELIDYYDRLEKVEN